MYISGKTWSNGAILPAVVLSIMVMTLVPTCATAQEDARAFVGFSTPLPYNPLVPISDEETFLGIHMNGMRSPLLKRKLSSFKREVKIDSTGKNINFYETLNGMDFRVPAYLTLNDYRRARRQVNLQTMWQRSAVSRIGERSQYERRGGGGLRIDIPVEIKNKAFQKIFGGGTVGLDVTGDITIRGGFRNEKRSEVKTALTRGSDNNFKMEQTQRFRVQGHVGDKVTIGVDQDSERAFDFENNIQLKYEGYEDEIIQSIEAGNIALSLPGTRFVTFGGQSSGLFGIKAAATLGNLKLTAIASQEKGENKKLSLKGGASEEAKRIEDYQYKRGTYYFIDEYYRQQYLVKNDEGYFIVDPNRTITQIELYKSEPNYQQRFAESMRGWALVPKGEESDIDRGDTLTVDPEHYRGYFIRLDKTDYYVDTRLGFIQLNVPSGDGEVLAVAYRDSSGRVRGDIGFNPDSSQIVQLRLLKTQTPRPSDKTWDLEWKNVYSLGSRNVPEDGFEIHIFYKPPSGDPEETITIGSDKKTYLEVFGLDRVDLSGGPNPDNVVDLNPNIINLARGEIIFPDLQPFDPVDQEYQDLLPEDKRSPAIYDTTVQSVITAQSKFYIEVKSRTRSSEYRLGMNIIENSEEVTLNGRKLVRGTDYTIDYFTGTLRVLNEEATRPSSNLDVTYESNQLFQIDKKTVMGVRAEYGLWDDSFIGGTFLYLNERTLDQKIRVGKGPMRNMVWDVNTSLSAKPFFLTRLANLLPFVDSRAPSSIKFEGEVAQVIPNPNTRNNEQTGDNDGVAYIDDFEASKRITPIGITQKSWLPCSPPIGKVDFSKTYPTLENRGHLVWYNPYGQYPIKWIWPNRDVNANVAQTTNILVMQFSPADSLPKLGRQITESWGGVQKALSAGYYDQTEAKFLEVWVKGDTGTVHIDLGQISEDIIPNKHLDTEDILRNGIRNDLLDAGEDVGLDGMGGADPLDYWDINGNGRRDFGEPISYDDWRFNPGNNQSNIDYSKSNGTEDNENDYGGRKPDSEDMNGNGDVDLRNDYFEYSFSLRRDHPDTMYIAGASISNETGEDYGWRQYRIPLEAPEPTLKKIGNPDLSLVEYIRVWVDGFDTQKTHDVSIAEINLVGSEWKEFGVASKLEPEKYDAKNDSTVTVTVVNTHDNPDYRPARGVVGEVDRITRVQAKEQSLVLKVDNLLPGENGIIQKAFYEAQDYIHYRTLKMYVYGHDPFGRHIKADTSRIQFFLRFGADMNNYYEVRQPVYEGWTNNDIEVDLVQLSAIKLIAQNYDSTRKVYYKDLGNGRSWVVKGTPALRNIRILVAGVKNLDYDELGVPAADVLPFTGEVYMNELRLSNVKKDKGMAMRASLDFAWADLMRFNGQVDKQDADFHNVATQYGDGDNRISGSFNTSFQLDKFLPSKLGLSIPINYNYARSEATPKYKPGTDVEVTNALPDSIIEQIRTINERQGFSVSLGFTSRSQNFFVKNLLTPLRASYSQTSGKGSDSRTKSSQNKSESANLDWGVNFGRNNFIKPFGFLGKSRLLTKITEMKVYYAPESFSTKMAGTRTNNTSLTRTGVESKNGSFNVNRTYAGQMKIFDNLSLDANRAYTHDLQGIPQDTLLQQIKQGQLGLLTSVSQNFSIKYNPKFFSWLTSNFSYTAAFKYGYNRQQRTQAKSATQNVSLSASGTLNLGALVKTIYRPSVSPAGRGPRPQPQRPKPGSKPEDQGEKEPKGKKPAPQEKSGGGFSVLGTFAKFFDLFEPFSINMSQRNSLNTYGLTGMPSLAFQFGLTDSLGVPLEFQSETGGAGTGGGTNLNRGSRSESQTISASSGIKLGRDISLSFKYDNNYSLNSSTTTTGQRSQTWLTLGDNVSMLFPDWTLRVGGLEKLPLVNKYIQRLSLEHGHSGQSSETFDVNKGVEVITKEDQDSQFRPLLGLTMSWKNGISMNVRYNTSDKTTLTRTFGISGNRTTSNDISMTANYSKRSDFRIPIPVWPFKNMRLKNSVDVSLTFSMGSNSTLKSRSGGDYEVTGETSKWFFKPNMNYSFSDRVRGGAHLEIGKTHNKLIGDSSYKEFGIDVNISIRGS